MPYHREFCYGILAANCGQPVARKDVQLLRVLHVEDDANDAVLFAHACKQAVVQVNLIRVMDVEQAKEYLLGQGEYADRNKWPLPQVVLLDLKLPHADGFELLSWLRGHPDFARLPVLVFTASVSREDQARAIAAGANSYYVKPASFEALVQMVGSLLN